MQKIIKATLIVTIFSVVTRFISFIYKIYLSRMMGSEGLGLYQIVLSVFAVLITATSSGIPIAVSRRVANCKGTLSDKACSGTVTASLIAGLIFSVSISAILFFGKDFFSFIFADKRCESIFLLLLPAVICSSMYSSFRGGLWGNKQYMDYSITELVEEIITVIAGILLIQGVVSIVGSAMGATFAITLSYIGASLLTIILYFCRGGKLSSPKGHFIPLFKSALPITGIRIIATLLQSFVALIFPIILGKYVGVENAISEYGILCGMTFPLLYLPSTLIGSLALVLVPEIASLSLKDDADEISRSVSKAIKFSILITFALIPIYIAVGIPICELVYNNVDAGKLLSLSAILMLPMGLSQICSSVLSSIGYEVKSLKNFLIGSIFLVICVVFLPKVLGISSIIVGYIFLYTISSFLNILDIKKHVQISSTIYKDCLFLTIFTIPAVLLGINVNSMLAMILPSIICIAISSIIMLVCMCLLTTIFNVADVSKLIVYLPKIKNFFKRKKHMKNG